MKRVVIICLAILVFSCQTKPTKSVELIVRAGQQDSLFHSLTAITNNLITERIKKDSLAFLILPLEASCPACRNKTIDSIIKYQNKLAANHFIILSAKAGRKLMSAFFREHESNLPDISGRLVLDSTNQADQYNLYKNNPAIYYAANSKVYKKVLALPITVKQDLQEFFLGWRNEK